MLKYATLEDPTENAIHALCNLPSERLYRITVPNSSSIQSIRDPRNLTSVVDDTQKTFNENGLSNCCNYFFFLPNDTPKETAQNESQSEPSQHLSANNVYHVEARQVSQDQKQKEKSASATPFRHCCTIPKRRQSPNQPTNRRRIPYAQEPDRTHRERERNSKSDSLRKANEEIEKEFDEPIKKSLCTNSKERERENTQQKNKR